jgi:hypothetical protein
MPLVGFEPTISEDERPQTYALDCAASGTGVYYAIVYVIINLWICNSLTSRQMISFSPEDGDRLSLRNTVKILAFVGGQSPKYQSHLL